MSLHENLIKAIKHYKTRPCKMKAILIRVARLITFIKGEIYLLH